LRGFFLAVGRAAQRFTELKNSSLDLVFFILPGRDSVPVMSFMGCGVWVVIFNGAYLFLFSEGRDVGITRSGHCKAFQNRFKATLQKSPAPNFLRQN
jgi:hypothetical protein